MSDLLPQIMDLVSYIFPNLIPPHIKSIIARIHTIPRYKVINLLHTLQHYYRNIKNSNNLLPQSPQSHNQWPMAPIVKNPPLSENHFIYFGDYKDTGHRAIPHFIGRVSSLKDAVKLAKSKNALLFGLQGDAKGNMMQVFINDSNLNLLDSVALAIDYGKTKCNKKLGCPWVNSLYISSNALNGKGKDIDNIIYGNSQLAHSIANRARMLLNNRGHSFNNAPRPLVHNMHNINHNQQAHNHSLTIEQQRQQEALNRQRQQEVLNNVNHQRMIEQQEALNRQKNIGQPINFGSFSW